MKVTRDELEFLISQYVDGTLNPLEQAGLEEILATDRNARALLAEYQGFNAMVKTALPAPDVDWEQFAARVSAETAKHDVPVRHFRLRLATVSKFAALAATVAIAFGIATKFRTPPGPGSTHVETGSQLAISTTPVEVQISAAPALAAAPVSDISIGQPPGFAAVDYHAAEAIISRPPAISIASGTGSAQDTDSVY
jgi:anti-sigma factor RsiW